MLTKSQDITLLIKKYGPGYIAESKKTGKIIDHSTNLKILFDRVKDKQNIVISWLPQPNTRYVLKLSV